MLSAMPRNRATASSPRPKLARGWQKRRDQELGRQVAQLPKMFKREQGPEGSCTDILHRVTALDDLTEKQELLRGIKQCPIASCID